MYKNRKPLIIGILCTLVVMMAVGFALLSQELTITGSSHIDSNWNIRITNIRVKNLVSAYATGDNASTDVVLNEGCTTTTAPCNTTTATFEASLKTPGDYITYEVTITNSGTLDGVVESINLVCSENPAITCTTRGLKRADKILKTNGTNTVDVTVTYNPETSTQPVNTNSTVTLTINYQQDLGQVVPVYNAYSIGDSITYKGSNWRVIKNSTASEDYVTLIKETVLTASEIGNNYSIKTDCKSYHVTQGLYGCTSTGQIVSTPSMAYYWSNTCHYSGRYGSDIYDSDVTTGCSTSSNYSGSKIKQGLESYMSNYLDESELKEVSGYKIRLISKDDLDNLGWVNTQVCTTNCYDKYGKTSSTPTWVYSESEVNSNGYWTMTPSANNQAYVFSVYSGGYFISGTAYSNIGAGLSVRPVINLLKSNIPAQS